MPKTEDVLSIFLASPSDVNDERDQVDFVVREWNSLWSDYVGVHLKLLKWETHAYPAAGTDGQDVINAEIDEEYDIFLGIMWKRFGTPTGRAASGTVEEFDRALARNRREGIPQLMFYFKKVALDTPEGDSQLEAIHQFRARLAKEGLLYWEFLNPEQFGQLARVHLTRHVQAWVKRNKKTHEAADPLYGNAANRYLAFLHDVKSQSVVIVSAISKFAKVQLAYNSEINRKAAEARAMTDDTPELVWKMSLIEIAHAMIRYADEAEEFESTFSSAFSVFLESALGAAAISIAFPTIKTKSLVQVLAELRRKLHPIYETTGKYIAEREKNASQLTGAMLTSNERSIAALGKFRDQARFGEFLLLEAEKLFSTKNRN